MMDASGRITCVPSPGRAFAGLLPTLGSMVGGQLYFVNNKKIAIRNFTYASTSPGKASIVLCHAFSIHLKVY